MSEEQRLRLAGALRLALDEEALHVEYQPIVHADGALCGFEALIRWRLSDGTSVAPWQLLQIAAGCGFTGEVTDALVAEVVMQAAQWRAACGRVPPVSINLSARDLERPDIARDILEHLDVQGLPRDTLVLEITESDMIRHVDGACLQLGLLRDAGLRVAIDDFGTGHSSLARLAQLPVDILKLDKAFLGGVPGDARREGIIRTVVRLARELGLELVAEGIEDPVQLAWLIDAGVQRFQGFLFHRPAPAAHWTQHQLRLRGWEETQRAPAA
jgi:EAL domain-containing protein (putative c-di-GMP-specific phosphodiesterase class I)